MLKEDIPTPVDIHWLRQDVELAFAAIEKALEPKFSDLEPEQRDKISLRLKPLLFWANQHHYSHEDLASVIASNFEMFPATKHFVSIIPELLSCELPTPA